MMKDVVGRSLLDVGPNFLCNWKGTTLKKKENVWKKAKIGGGQGL